MIIQQLQNQCTSACQESPPMALWGHKLLLPKNFTLQSFSSQKTSDCRAGSCAQGHEYSKLHQKLAFLKKNEQKSQNLPGTTASATCSSEGMTIVGAKGNNFSYKCVGRVRQFHPLHCGQRHFLRIFCNAHTGKEKRFLRQITTKSKQCMKKI